MPLLIFTGLVFETDLSLLLFENALRAQCRPIDVGGEILEGRFSAPGGLHMDAPLLPPDRGGNLQGVGLALQRGLSRLRKRIAQDLIRQKKVGRPGPASAQPSLAQSPRRAPRNERGDGTGAGGPRYGARLKIPVGRRGIYPWRRHPAR